MNGIVEEFAEMAKCFGEARENIDSVAESEEEEALMAGSEEKEDEEQETEDTEVETSASPTETTPNAINLMNGKYGGKFLARYLYDVNTSRGWIQLIICYPFGAVKKILLKKNAAKRAEWGGTGVETVGEGKEEFAPTRKLGYCSAPNGLLMEYETPDMPIPFTTIWKKIVENFENLPRLPVSVCESWEDVYETLIETGEAQAASNPKLADKTYVLLTRQDIVKVAEEFGSNFVAVRAEFASNGWWDIDSNSKGYQKTIKIDGKNKKFYALKRNRKSVGIEDFTDVNAIDQTDFEDFDTLETDRKKIAEIRRRETELQNPKKKGGKEPIRLLNLS